MSRDADLPVLQQLPQSVFREAVDRLNRGQKIKTVVRWLMSHPRGELQHEGHYLVRKHVIELQSWIQEHNPTCCGADGSAIPPLTSAKARVASQLQTAEEIADIAQKLTARTVLARAFIDAVADLQHGHPADRLNARRDIFHIGQVLEKLEDAERRSRRHDNGDCGPQAGNVAGAAESENVGHIELPELTPGQLELQNNAKEMTPTSRMFVNDLATSMRQILKLEKQIRESDTAPASPKLPSESPNPEGRQS